MALRTRSRKSAVRVSVSSIPTSSNAAAIVQAIRERIKPKSAQLSGLKGREADAKTVRFLAVAMSKPATITAVKGFRDVLPEESVQWRALEQAAERCFGAYGYGDVRLPVLERTELFARSLGETTDVVEKEMFAFTDRDGTGVALRPEATASVVRLYLEEGLAARD